jgi:hypothetical protein
MGKVRVVCFQVQSSEGGRPHLCRLRTDHLALVNKIDNVLAHTGFIGSCKLSSFDERRVGRYLTLPQGCTLG